MVELVAVRWEVLTFAAILYAMQTKCICFLHILALTSAAEPALCGSGGSGAVALSFVTRVPPTTCPSNPCSSATAIDHERGTLRNSSAVITSHPSEGP